MPTPTRNYEVLVQETYEALLQPGDIAVDVGAHRGRHTIPMAECVAPGGRVLAFEPLDECRACLASDIHGYRSELAGIIELHGCALSNFTGEAEFVIAKDALAYSGLRERRYDWPTAIKRVRVPVRRLDEFCADLPALRFLKLDAEGGEYHILLGARETLRRHRPIVAFEFGVNSIGGFGITLDQMAEIWFELEYGLFDILGRELDRNAFLQSARDQEVWDYLALPIEQSESIECIRSILRPPLIWPLVTTHLDSAEHNLLCTERRPKLQGFRGWKGWLANRLIHLLNHGMQSVLEPHRSTTRELLWSVRSLHRLLRDRDRQIDSLTRSVAELQTRLDRTYANETAA